MKRLRGILALVCLFCAGSAFLAQSGSNEQSEDDGYFIVFVNIGYSGNYLSAYSDVESDFIEFEDYEIDGDPFNTLYSDAGIVGAGFGDSLSYTVTPGESYDAQFSYEIEYICDGEAFGCEDLPEGDASIYVQFPPPQISSISPSSVNEGDQGTLTVNGSNLIESAGDQLTINYSGGGNPFTLSSTPSVCTATCTATFSYDFTGYTPGTYTVSVSNNEGTSNSETFTVNAPLNACSQSTVPNSVTLQIVGFGNGGESQSGTFTLSHPTVMASGATTTVSYGPFSTPSSIASSIASAIVRNYAQFGVTAQSNGPDISLESRTLFGTITSSSSGSVFGINIGTPSTVSCIALPHLPCLGLLPDYDTARLYKGGITETPREHITRKHIIGPATAVPLNTIYTGNGGPPPFKLIQGYNFTTVLLHPFPINGILYKHTFEKTTEPVPGGTEDSGWIGADAAGNDLYTNNLYLSPDRCTVDTSYPSK